MPEKFPLTKRALSKWLTAVAALADQVWLSALNFIVALTFIRDASKRDYALFVLLQAPILLIQGVQNALFISPQATLLPATSESRKPVVKNTASAGQATIALSAAIISGTGLFVYRRMTDHTDEWTLASAYVVTILGAMAREGVRALRYAEAHSVRALAGDLAYGLSLLLTLAILVGEHAVTVRNVLIVMGLTGLIPLAHAAWRQPLPNTDRTAWEEFWACGRWALPSVIATWLNLNAYPYIAALALGSAAVADLSAARLFVMPIGVSITAWSNLMRPKISALISRSDQRTVRRLSLTSLAVAESGLLIFVLIIALAYPLLQKVMGTKYQGLLPLILLWSLLFSMSLMRSIFMATLMARPAGYRQLHHLSWFSLAIGLPTMALLAHKGPIWVVGILCCVEGLTSWIVAKMAINTWKRSGSLERASSASH